MPNKVRAGVALVIGIIGVGSVVAQSQFGTRQRAPRLHHTPPPVIPRPAPQFGDPLANLTVAELADFTEGREDFQDEDTPGSGLGPVFNNVSCVACHSSPAIGGVSAIFVTRFGHLANGQFDPMTALGGSLLQQSAIDPAALETVPATANVVARRMTTPLFGAGLVEAIPDLLILQNALAPKPDGISGRISLVQDVATGRTRIGRFGWKAQQANLLSFAGDAYLNEIGITSRLFPQENAPGGDAALLARFDKVSDPEDVEDPDTGKADIDRFADFMRLLAPPPQLPPTPAASAGKDVFANTGCANCHKPFMFTGQSNVAALDRKLVPLFSDLLLHDMGSLGDGIVQGSARQSEMKTAPLWGLRVRGPFLHDGRAATVEAAIRMHDGEASRTRDRYNQLGSAQQQQLLEYLNSI